MTIESTGELRLLGVVLGVLLGAAIAPTAQAQAKGVAAEQSAVESAYPVPEHRYFSVRSWPASDNAMFC
jgi:hypothetical protein